MTSDDFSQKLDRFTHGIVRRKVKQLIGRAGFQHRDREDLEQELLLRVLQSLPSFDATQAHRNVFITTVVERATANLLRDKTAAKRDHRRLCSLNVMIEVADEGLVELAQTISDRELNARLCIHRRAADELAHLAQDVADLVSSLPDRERDLLERILKSQTVTEIAREFNVPRTTVSSRVHRLLERFEQTGLKDYL